MPMPMPLAHDGLPTRGSRRSFVREPIRSPTHTRAQHNRPWPQTPHASAPNTPRDTCLARIQRSKAVWPPSSSACPEWQVPTYRLPMPHNPHAARHTRTGVALQPHLSHVRHACFMHPQNLNPHLVNTTHALPHLGTTASIIHVPCTHRTLTHTSSAACTEVQGACAPGHGRVVVLQLHLPPQRRLIPPQLGGDGLALCNSAKVACLHAWACSRVRPLYEGVKGMDQRGGDEETARVPSNRTGSG